MDEKKRAIEALDAALDREIIKYARLFVHRRDYRDLEVLATLVTVDRYTDKFLDDEVATDTPATRAMIR